MNEIYDVRPYQSGDEKGIVELLQLVFEGWPHFNYSGKPIDHWKWKYQSNPVGNGPIYVAEKEDKIVGSYHTVLQHLKYINRTVLWGDGTDAAAHPDFRNMGIYNKTLKKTQESMNKNGVKYWRGITANPILVRSLSKRYPHLPQSLSTLVRINDFTLHMQKTQSNNSFIKKLGYQTLKIINKMKNSQLYKQTNTHCTRITQIEHFDKRINKFWEEISGQYDFIAERKMNYLNWRYCDKRGGDYIVRLAEDNGQIQGYLVLRINRYRKDYPVGTIVDLVTSPNRLDVLDILVADAVRHLDEQDINQCRYLVLSNHPYERALKHHGFLDIREKTQCFYVPLGEKEKLDNLNTSNVTRMLFSYGDTDWI